ncbi:MAG: hypothetical protein IJU98_09475 [Synergistaceae bacterium]|nr:hypothetical protein [Synergistaceae bacterium]
MRNRKFLAVLAAMGLAFLAVAGGGCGGSSHHGASSRDQFVDAVGTVVDDLQAIADSAVSNRKVITAINDIVSQYLVSSAEDATVRNRAIGRTFTADDIVIRDFTGNPNYDKAAFVKIWSNKHITVKNNVVETFVTGQSDFQLTITGSDGHVTKLTITPDGSTGYWQALSQVSALLNALYGEETAGQVGEKHNYLVFAYVYASANMKVEYDGTTLLDGKVSLSYSGKTPDSTSDPVYANTPHTTKYALTLYPQDNKDYTVGIDLTRETKSSGDNAVSNSTQLKLYRKGSDASTKTLLDVNAGVDATVPSGSTRPSAASLTALDLNIADRIRLAESSPLDLVSLMGLYVTGTSATEETVKGNVASINTLLSNAGLSVYLNKSATKAGDIRALAGKIGSYNHARFGIQFNGASEPELVRDIANPDDMQQLKALVGKVAPQIQALAQLLTGTGLQSELTDNEIIQIIFEDLFGTD